MREMSDYGKKATENFTTQLVKEGYTIVSGMARGVDRIAHKSAIAANGKTIAVLGTGIDYCYPKENRDIYEEMKKNHLVLSEYPWLVAPQKRLFPFRNRIISGLSESLLISEARVKSGTMITAGYALEPVSYTHLKMTESIIYSMTKEERRNPDILNAKRKERIAKGCGRSVADVNRLIKQFEASRQMMKQMGNLDPVKMCIRDRNWNSCG